MSWWRLNANDLVQYLLNGGVSCTYDQRSTILTNAIKIGLTYKPAYFQVWTQDRTDPTLWSTLAALDDSIKTNYVS
jgi:hypothetical protein